jgi:hypothetical protein
MPVIMQYVGAIRQKDLLTTLTERGFSFAVQDYNTIQVKALSLAEALCAVGIAMDYDIYAAKVARDATDCAYHVYIEITCNDPTKRGR